MAEFTGILAEVAAIVGDDVAMAIASEYGGLRCYLPSVASLTKKRRKPLRLVQIIGFDAAMKIAQSCVSEVGLSVAVPLNATSARNALSRQIDAQLSEGLGTNTIARNLHVSRRTVQLRRRYLANKANHPTISRQPNV